MQDDFHQFQVLLVHQHGVHEGLVDLELRRGDVLEVGQRRKPGAEIVDGNIDAHRLDPQQVVIARLLVLHHRALGDLHRDLVGGDPPDGDSVVQHGGQVGVAGQVGRHIHGDTQVQGALPGLYLAQAAVHHPLGKVIGVPGGLGPVDNQLGGYVGTVGRLPAQQGLHAAHPAGGDFDLRLEIQLEGIVLQGLAELLLQSQVARLLGILGEDILYAPTATHFGVGQGGLRQGQHRHGLANPLAVDDYARLDVYPQQVPVPVQLTAQHALHPVEGQGDIGRIAQVLENEGEAVAAHAEH